MYSEEGVTMCKAVTVKFKKLSPNAKPFVYTREDDACMDMYSLEDLYLLPNQAYIVKTGIAVEIPEGYEGIVRGRSGLASRGIFVHVGTIESAYRGDVGVIMLNTNEYAYHVAENSRIAQFTVKPIYRVTLEEANELTKTLRGEQGYGSSGI